MLICYNENMKKSYKSSSKNESSKVKYNYKFDIKDDSLINIGVKTPKGNNININFVVNPKMPDMRIQVKE